MAMAFDRAIARYRHWYRKLLRLYSRQYRDRFAESMEQTFDDLCRERAKAGDGLLGFVLWVFAETSAGILREKIMQSTTRRLIVWASVVASILLVPLVAMQFSEELNWDLLDFVVMGTILFGAALTYELVARKGTRAYRAAVGFAIATAVVLLWVSGAVGIF